MPLPRTRVRAVAALGFVALTVAIASIGGPATPAQSFAAVLWWTLRSGLAPALFILSAFGLGRLALPLFAGAKERWAIQAGAGLSIQLAAGHIVNCAGAWLPGIAWNLAALVPAAVGLVLFAVSMKDVRPMRPWNGIGAGAIPLAACVLALAIMLIASLQAPGILWASEFGGFDVLSYHLQLPREWLELGRLAPLNHNVYSYLPSFFESAFLTIQLWTFAPRSTPTGISGMLADDGWRTISCQLLHVGFGIVAAWLIAAGTREMIGRVRSGADPRERLVEQSGGLLGAAAFLGVPWIVVVGSMAYNELALCALFAGALLVAVDRGVQSSGRGLLVGWLVGIACGVKPTALVLVAPAAGLAMLWVSPARVWLKLVAFASIAGLAALLPWLIRNWFASGNPVFPYAHTLFAGGHWTAEQYGRFAGAHHFDGSWMDRLRLLFLIDPNDPAGARHRGMMHPQWSAFFPLLGAAALVGLAAKGTRRIAGLLSALVLVQVVAWLAFTHLQSRFLIPLAVPGAMLIGLVSSGVWIDPRSVRWDLYRRLAVTVGGVCAGFLAMRSLDAFWSEQGGRPNQMLALGPAVLAQEGLRVGDGAQVKPGEKLYLLGDSTPFYLPGPLVYHATWDASPLGDAVRGSKEGAGAAFEWSGKLLDRGIGAVLINFSELGRLIESKWYDPAVSREVIARWFEATKPAAAQKSSPEDLQPVVRPIRAREAKP